MLKYNQILFNIKILQHFWPKILEVIVPASYLEYDQDLVIATPL